MACTTASTMSVTKAANRTIPLPSNRMLLSGSGFIKSSLRILSSCALQFSVEIRGDKEGDRDGVPIIRSPFTALAVGYEQCVSFYALAVAREVLRMNAKTAAGVDGWGHANNAAAGRSKEDA